MQAYKALSVVCNVKQGELIKQLIKENEELKKQKVDIFKMKEKEISVLKEFLHAYENEQCRRCNEWSPQGCYDWLDDSWVINQTFHEGHPFDECGDLPEGIYCDECKIQIEAFMDATAETKYAEDEENKFLKEQLKKARGIFAKEREIFAKVVNAHIEEIKRKEDFIVEMLNKNV